ncbi:NitT/TauT family transport system substrate-binding protein [Pseudomonas fluvialis]|uniref:NitT/TauT family transport system substrate-binding protein n=1 Tax=Pseudomonas fluvialis TaxID=1793966 RepID=A0A7X0ESU9_9PSED|nr:ABC transporter substrate-binding protein [Pseudomonas fluvialis]MBB6342947.1 NitT/TauT family transport system substrate-binding protein [Pseudomonas fluvialis]
MSAAFCHWLTRGAPVLLLLLLATPTPAAKLSLAVARTPLSLPIFVAADQGYFRAEGLDVQLREVSGGHRALEAVLAGQADVGTASDSVLMFNSLKRDDFVSLGYFVSSPSDLAILASSSSTNQNPEDWRGKAVGVVKGASSEYLMHSWLLLNGIDPQSVEFVDMQPDAMPAALAQHKVAAVSIWEPTAFTILQQVTDSRVLPSAGLHTLTFHLLSRRETASTRVLDMQALLRAIDQAESFIRQHPQRAQAILRDTLEVDWAFIDWIWPRYHYQLGLDQALISSLESQARWSMENGLANLAQMPNYLHFIDSQPLRAVRSSAVSLIE